MSARAATASAAAHMASMPGPGEPSGFLVVPGRAEGVERVSPAFRAVSNLATRSLRLSLSSAGAAKGQSDLGYLPKPFQSPSGSCNHDLGGLKILADKLKDDKGKIIGVLSVHVTCSECKGKPYLTGKYADTEELQTAARNVTIPAYLPAAQALFASGGAAAVWPEE